MTATVVQLVGQQAPRGQHRVLQAVAVHVCQLQVVLIEDLADRLRHRNRRSKPRSRAQQHLVAARRRAQPVAAVVAVVVKEPHARRVLIGRVQTRVLHVAHVGAARRRHAVRLGRPIALAVIAQVLALLGIHQVDEAVAVGVHHLHLGRADHEVRLQRRRLARRGRRRERRLAVLARKRQLDRVYALVVRSQQVRQRIAVQVEQDRPPRRDLAGPRRLAHVDQQRLAA